MPLDDAQWAEARTLVASLAHDVNNLLSPLLLQAELLESALNDPAQRQRAAAIAERASRLASLLESARWIYREEPWEGNATAEGFWRHLVVLVRPAFSLRGHRVWWAVREGLPAPDAARLGSRFALTAALRAASERAAPGECLLALADEKGARLYQGRGVADAARWLGLQEGVLATVAPEHLAASAPYLAQTAIHDLP